MCAVLCVEDHRHFFDTFSAVLLKTAETLTPPHLLTLDWVFDLAEAEKSLQRVKYDAIFLDLILPPVFDDLDTLRWLNHHTRHSANFPAVIVTTASVRPEIRTLSLQAGAQGFLAKEDIGELPKQTLVNLDNCIKRLKDSRTRYAQAPLR